MTDEQLWRGVVLPPAFMYLVPSCFGRANEVTAEDFVRTSGRTGGNATTDKRLEKGRIICAC